MKYRLLSAIILAFTAVSCGIGDVSGYKYKSTKIDPTDLFFSGEYSLIDDGTNFKDCATGRVINFKSNKINDINKLYLAEASRKGESVFCSFKGHYDSVEFAVWAANFIGFNITETCAPMVINRVYAAQGDTLTLGEDFRYNLKIKGSEPMQGNWGRTYKDVGVLMIDGESGVEFTINEGNEDDNNNLFLSLEGVDGKGVVFLPIKTN